MFVFLWRFLSCLLYSSIAVNSVTKSLASARAQSPSSPNVGAAEVVALNVVNSTSLCVTSGWLRFDWASGGRGGISGGSGISWSF